MISWLFDTTNFVARHACSGWTTALGNFHNLCDVAIWLAYMVITVAVVTVIRRRHGQQFASIFWLLGGFVFACGWTHFNEMLTYYWPAYRFSGAIKLVCAIVSWIAVVVVVRKIPQIVRIPSNRELQETARGLQNQLLMAMNRSADLERKNLALQVDRSQEIMRVIEAATEKLKRIEERHQDPPEKSADSRSGPEVNGNG